jgi:hypothetical protein
MPLFFVSMFPPVKLAFFFLMYLSNKALAVFYLLIVTDQIRVISSKPTYHCQITFSSPVPIIYLASYTAIKRQSRLLRCHRSTEID